MNYKCIYKIVHELAFTKIKSCLVFWVYQVLHMQAILEVIHFKLQPLFKRTLFKTQLLNCLMVRHVFTFNNFKSLPF